MNKIKENFFDGVETIHLLNSTVRMDFFTLQPPKDGEKPVPEVQERVVMPIQSFLNMHAAMQQIIDKLVENGLVKTQQPNMNNWEKTNWGHENSTALCPDLLIILNKL